MNLLGLLVVVVLTALSACGGGTAQGDNQGPAGAAGNGGSGTGGGGAPGAGGSSNPEPDGSMIIVRDQHTVRELTAAGDYLYWIGDTDAPDLREVRRCRKSDCGGTVTTLTRVPGAAVLRVASDRVFIVGWSGILSCPLTGCDTPTDVIVDGRTEFIAVEEPSLYWTRYRDGAIYTCLLPWCGAMEARVVAMTSDRRWFSMDEAHLYWLTGALGDSITFARKDGSAPQQLFAKN